MPVTQPWAADNIVVYSSYILCHLVNWFNMDFYGLNLYSAEFSHNFHIFLWLLADFIDHAGFSFEVLPIIDNGYLSSPINTGLRNHLCTPLCKHQPRIFKLGQREKPWWLTNALKKLSFQGGITILNNYSIQQPSLSLAWISANMTTKIYKLLTLEYLKVGLTNFLLFSSNQYFTT